MFANDGGMVAAWHQAGGKQAGSERNVAAYKHLTSATCASPRAAWRGAAPDHQRKYQHLASSAAKWHRESYQ